MCVYTKVYKCVYEYTHVYVYNRYAGRSPGMIYEYTCLLEKDAAGTCPPRVAPFPVQTSHTGEEDFLSYRTIRGFIYNVEDGCQIQINIILLVQHG